MRGDSRMNDPVNHPEHYCQGNIECIDVITAALGTEGAKAFCIGNAIKYLFRHRNKGDAGQDVRKARWYINRWVMLDEAGEENEEEEDITEEEYKEALKHLIAKSVAHAVMSEIVKTPGGAEE